MASSDASNSSQSPISVGRSHVMDYIETFPKLANYSHLLTVNEKDSYANIRAVLDNTLTTDRALTSPSLFRTIFSTGLKNFYIRDDLDDHRFAMDFLIDPRTDKSQIEFVDVAGPSAEAMYFLIAAIPSVKKLALEPYRLYGDNAIENILARKDLVELEVRCSSRPCIFQNCDSEPNAWRRLKRIMSTYMPTLRTLTLSCQCEGNNAYLDHVAMEMAVIISHIPNLTSIRVAASSRVSEIVYQFIWKTVLPRAKLEFFLVGDRIFTTRSSPHNFWKHVTRADIKRARQQDVRHLAAFKGLVEIKLDITDDAEHAFTQLSLGRVKLFHVRGSPAAEAGSGGVYYELKKDVVHTAISFACNVEDISLVYCRVGSKVIQKLLLNAGKKLKSFEISLLDQEECPSQRLIIILEGLKMFNQNLRRFKVSECVVEEVACRLKWGTKTYYEYSQLYSQLDLACQQLCAASPQLDTMNLCDVVQSLNPQRHVVRAMRTAHGVFVKKNE